MTDTHPITDAVAALAEDGYDQAHVDLAEYLDDETARTADLLGVKGPDVAQWGDVARADRGAEVAVSPADVLPRGDG